MQAVIFEEVIQRILKDNSNMLVGELTGRIVDGKDLLQIMGIKEEDSSSDNMNPIITSGEPARPVGFYVKSRELSLSEIRVRIHDFIKGRRIEGLANPIVLALAQDEKTYGSAVYVLEEASLEAVEHKIISFRSQMFERVRKIVEPDVISRKTATIVGLGTGGSTVALELAKCGLGTIKLIDYDRIEAHNIPRHVCGILDIGRLKTLAVKDRILQHNPFACVTTYEIDVLKSRDMLASILSESDLIVAATGSPVVNNIINEISLKYGIPAVYAGVWERGMGGYVMRVIPGKTACFNCVHETLLKNAPPLDRTRLIDYSTVTDPNELRAEPGISIDVNIIALLQAKLSLLTILQKESQNPEDIPQDYVLWFNRSYDRFKPFTCLKVYTKRRNDCAVCNYEKWLENKGKMLDEGTKTESEKTERE